MPKTQKQKKRTITKVKKQKKRNITKVKKLSKHKPIASIGGLTLHQIGGSLKGFRQRLLKKLCKHPRRPTR
jgi:hypothetical protein